MCSSDLVMTLNNLTWANTVGAITSNANMVALNITGNLAKTATAGTVALVQTTVLTMSGTTKTITFDRDRKSVV